MGDSPAENSVDDLESEMTEDGESLFELTQDLLQPPVVPCSEHISALGYETGNYNNQAKPLKPGE